MTAIQLKQEFFQEFSTITGDESFWRDAIATLRRLVKLRLSSSVNVKVEDKQPKKRKVKDLSPEEKREYLHQKAEQYKDEYPEIDELFDRMRLSKEELQDEKTRYILGL
ncbi:MAG: hypothetical protein IKO99_01165 [Bacteroidales bacterium]|nr:hypothetical protein [Bacteroidales bacterium]